LRRRRCCESHKGRSDQRHGGCRGHFQKLFHLALSVLAKCAGLSALHRTWDARVRSATRACLMRAQTCYLLVRSFDHRCAVCCKETESARSFGGSPP
jgi:hypothetical protein